MFIRLEERDGQFILTQSDAKGERGLSSWVPLRHGNHGSLVFPGGRDSEGKLYIEIEGLLARSQPTLRCVWDGCHYAPSDAPVLIRGESGVGKERFARLVHVMSHHGKGPFVSLNCASLPTGLAEAELFGHERGAFTGANESRPGLFELASGGTLFLDEVGELSPLIQAKLLRVLETGEVRRVGAGRIRKVSVRVVSATHRDLSEEVERGRFRLDLLFRLGVLPIVIPPLWARLDDFSVLTQRFLEEKGFAHGLTPQAMNRMRQHSWPGNIREMRNVLQRALLRAEGGAIRVEHLVFGPLSFLEEKAPIGSLHAQMDQVILKELKRQGGHRRRTYESLRMPRSSFYRWLRRHRNHEQLKIDPLHWSSSSVSISGDCV